MVDEKPQINHSVIAEKDQNPELKNLHEYLEKEVYPALQISAIDEEKMIAEAEPERRDLLRRSFDNIRKTVQAFFEIETVDGRFDLVSFQKERDLMVSKQVYSIIISELEKLGFTKDQLQEMGISETTTGFDFRRQVEHYLYQQNIIFNGRVSFLAERAILEQVRSSFLQQKSWRGFNAQPIYLEIIDQINKPTCLSPEVEESEANFLRELRQAVDQEEIIIRQQYKEKEISLGREIYQLERHILDLDRAKKIIEPSSQESRFWVRRSRDQVLAEIIQEHERVKQAQFVAINLPAKRVVKLLSTNRLLGIFSLDEELKNKRAGELGDGAEFYLRQRQAIEESLGIHSREQSVVYGCYCSANGQDELWGGARVYGHFFVTLKPETMKRIVFTEGDSLTNHGLTKSVAKKVRDQGVSVVDYDKFALVREVSLEQAPLAKALFNIEAQRAEQFEGHRDDFSYIEAHILGGVTADDIETINIPQGVLDFCLANADQGNDVEAYENLQNNSQWKDRVRVTAGEL